MLAFAVSSGCEAQKHWSLRIYMQRHEVKARIFEPPLLAAEPVHTSVFSHYWLPADVMDEETQTETDGALVFIFCRVEVP
jgi:hypothetical protein